MAGELKIEVRPVHAAGGKRGSGLSAGKAAKAAGTLTESLDDSLAGKIGSAIQRIEKGLASTLQNAKRVEVEFGIEIEAGGDIVVVSTKAGATLTIRVEWAK